MVVFHWLLNLFGRNRKNGPLRKTGARPAKAGTPARGEPEKEDRTLAKKLDDNKRVLQEIFDRCDDLVMREIVIGQTNPTRLLIAFLDPLVDFTQLHNYLLNPLMTNPQVPPAGVTIQWLKEQAVPAGQVAEHHRWLGVAHEITDGLVAIFVDGQNRALVITAFESNSREISQPISESVSRGASEALIENGRTGLSLVRKRLRTTRLAVERVEVGAVSKATIYVLYLKGYVYEGLPEEIKNRLSRIRIDGILGSGQIEELINDSPYSPVSGLGVTERPDRIVAALLEGKAALVFSVTPYALIVPVTMNSEMQSPEDYYNRYFFANFIRLVRWGALLTAMLAPAFYVAITSYHQELIPTDLLMTLLTTRIAVPFPVMVEALIMLLAFELLQEAGIRLPKPFGQTIGVVGAILIGQIAVSAGLVSPAVVMVTALTAIASYTLPSLNLSTGVRVLRFLFIFSAGFLGLFGVMAMFTMATFQLCAFRSFGVPFLSPFAPLSLGDLKDTFIRVPIWAMGKRPQFTGYVEPQRQHADLKPRPPASRARNSGDSGKERG